jgi:hypothetical protein
MEAVVVKSEVVVVSRWSLEVAVASEAVMVSGGGGLEAAQLVSSRSQMEVLGNSTTSTGYARKRTKTRPCHHVGETC